MHRYAAFTDGPPNSSNKATHLIREVEPGRWEVVANLPYPAIARELVSQLNASYDLVRNLERSTSAAENSPGIPVPPRPPITIKPTAGLVT